MTYTKFRPTLHGLKILQLSLLMFPLYVHHLLGLGMSVILISPHRTCTGFPGLPQQSATKLEGLEQ